MFSVHLGGTIIGCPCPIQAYTHLDDHAPSILTNYKISSPLKNYSCQYNSTIGGLMAVKKEQNLWKKKNTTLPRAKLWNDNMRNIIQKHPWFCSCSHIRLASILYFNRQLGVKPDQICFDISDGMTISRDLQLGLLQFASPHSRAVHKRYCRLWEQLTTENDCSFKHLRLN